MKRLIIQISLLFILAAGFLYGIDQWDESIRRDRIYQVWLNGYLTATKTMIVKECSGGSDGFDRDLKKDSTEFVKKMWP